MWSGPRNISTAMMRSFGARADCAVTDEPFYAAYLAATGLVHPMREEVIASQPTDWREVADALVGPPPDGKPRLVPEAHDPSHAAADSAATGCDGLVNAFLIRAPEAVLASYSREARRFHPRRDRPAGPGRTVRPRRRPARPRAAGGREPGRARRPARRAAALCAACGVPFDDAMLSWAPGRRATDGVWAPAWYEAVERSTQLRRAARARSGFDDLPDALKPLAEAARPIYDRLAAHKLGTAALDRRKDAREAR